METMTIHNNPDEVAGSDASYDGRLACREVMRQGDAPAARRTGGSPVES